VPNFANLDPFDLAILDAIQDDSSLPHATIGARVNLSGSAVRRRIAVMKRAGVIERERALLAFDALGPRVRLLVSVVFDRESPAIYDGFRAAMIAEPWVTHCFSTAGTTDFMLIVEAPSVSDYERWGERVLMSNTDIKRYESTVVWSTVKEVTRRVRFDIAPS
jgi:Lrp/AsnC family transcriptional regulator, leucine-responsive regulatory protein